MQQLVDIMVLGLASFFFVEGIRQLPLINGWTLEGVKPFACHLCMSFWTALVLGAIHTSGALPVGHSEWSHAWFLAKISGGAGGVCLAILYWSDSSATPPPME